MTTTMTNVLRLDYLTGTTAADRLRALKGVPLPVALVSWPNAQPYCFGWDGRNGTDYVPLELHLRSLLNECPDLRFILSFGSLHGTPYYWSSDHHDQLAVYECSRPMQQASLGSKAWKTGSTEAARRFAAHFQSSEFADRIVGFFPFSTGVDWMGTGECKADIPPQETPKNSEFPLEGDFSEPMQQAFREFLTGKYGTDAGLQAAWKNSSVSLDRVRVPARIEVRSPLPHVRDYFECYNQLNAELCIAWCRALKQGAPGKQVFVTHGQTFGWPAENLSPQGSGHNAPELLLKCPAIDGFISAAVQERNRRNPLPRHPAASLKHHGKQVVHELTLPGLRETTIEDQLAEITLGFGYAAAHGCAVSVAEPRLGRGSMKDNREQFNPLPYDHEAVRARLAGLLDWHSALKPGASVAEVAVFHSPSASYQRAMEKRFNEEHIERFRNETLRRIGLPFDEYLLSDFAAVSGNYKAWIFIDAADISSSDWKTVEENSACAFFACTGEPVSDPAVLRTFARNNGVTVWTDSNDTLFAGDRVCVFAACSAGEKTIRLPAGSWKNALTGGPVSTPCVFQASEKQVILFERV